MKNIALGLCLLLKLACFAQPTGTLKIYLSPPAKTVVIDDEELKYGNTADLKPGKYFLKAWAPDMKLLDTIVEVKAGEVSTFFYRFRPSAEYLSHQKKLSAYSADRGKNFLLPLSTTALVAGSLIFTYIKGSQVRTQTLDAYEEYRYAHTDLQLSQTKSEFESLQDKYRGYVTAYYIEWGALALSSYFLYKGIKWARQNKRPVYNAPKNPLTLNQVGFTRDRVGNLRLGLTFNLN